MIDFWDNRGPRRYRRAVCHGRWPKRAIRDVRERLAAHLRLPLSDDPRLGYDYSGRLLWWWLAQLLRRAPSYDTRNGPAFRHAGSVWRLDDSGSFVEVTPESLGRPAR